MPAHKPMLPTGQLPPERVVAPEFILRPFFLSDNEADYEAWSTSIPRLKGIFGPESTWPSPDITLQDNAIEAAWHQREFTRGSSYAYSVFAPDDTTCIGAVYFTPARKQGFDVDVYYWVRESAAALDERLGDFIRSWISGAWPFQNPAYPGRDIDWDIFQRLGDQPHW